MSILLGSAYGKVSIDASGVEKGVSTAKASMKSMGESAKQLGATLQNVGKTMTASLTVPLMALGVASIKSASDLEETKNKVKVVFEEMSDDVLAWGENAATGMGQSKQEALEAAATFGNLFYAMGVGKEQTAKMSMSLIQLAADLGSFNNMDPGVVIQKLQSGMVGEVEAVRSLGIDLRQTTVEAKAMEMGFQLVNGQFAAGDLIMARYAIIMQQTSKAQGDFARTSGGLANELRTLSGHWKDIQAILGKYLLPIATKLIHILNEWLEKFKNLPEPVQKTIVILLALVAVIGPLLIVIGAIAPALGAAKTALNPFSGGIFGVIGTVTNLIGTFVKLVGIAAVVVTVLEFFGVSTGAVGAAILGLNAALAGLAGSVLAVLAPILIIIATIGFLYWAFKTNFMGITTTAQQLWFIIKYYFGEGWKWLTQSTSQGLASVVAKFKSINWRQLGQNIIKGIVDGFKSGVQWLINAATNAARSAYEAMRHALDAHSPSRKTFQLGVWSGQGFIMGLQKAMDPNTIARMVSRGGVTNNSRNDSTTINLAAGMTVRSARRLLGDNRRELLNELAAALG